MASPEAEALKEQYRMIHDAVLAADHPPTLEEMRAGVEPMAELATVPDRVSWQPVDAGGVPAIWAIPHHGVLDRVVLYLHGGGYVIGSARIYERFTGHLANAVGCRVLSLDYRLAPEHPHPAAVEDACAAYRWLLGQGILPEHVAVAGDSAGGGLTVAALLKVRDDGLPLPACAVPISPWIDLEGTGGSMKDKAEVDLLVELDGLLTMAAHFLGPDGDRRDPLAAPLHADFTGLPPLYVQVGEDETLLDDSVRLAELATKVGVDVTLEVFPEMQHVFQTACGAVPEATAAVAKIGAWLRPRLGV
jgi:epsilon-lactone hydrolase